MAHTQQTTTDNTPVLVTGAAGFIGSHLVERLVTSGRRVRAFVRYTSRADLGLLDTLPPAVRAQVDVVRGDLRDSSAVMAAMAGCDDVYHLGALIAIPYSYLHPREVIETNVIGTVNVLEAARQTRPRRIIHTSSSEVYGTAITPRIDETHPLQGQSPYAASKIGADRIAESYYRAFDVPVVTVRPFNTYGPRQSGRAIIPTLISQALSGPVVRVGALTPTRDFTYVTDTVEGFLAAAAAPADRVLGRDINLGTDNEVSIADLAQMVLELVGGDLTLVCETSRLRPDKSEVDRLHSNNALALELMDWRPTVTLREGLTRTINWIRDNLAMYRVGTYEV